METLFDFSIPFRLIALSVYQQVSCSPNSRANLLIRLYICMDYILLYWQINQSTQSIRLSAACLGFQPFVRVRVAII